MILLKLKLKLKGTREKRGKKIAQKATAWGEKRRKKGKKRRKKAKKASAKDERKKGIGRKKGKTTVVYRYWFFCHIVKHQQLAEDPSQIGIFAAALLEAKQIVGIKRISAEALQFSFATQLGSWVRLATQPLKSPFGNATKGVNMLWPNNPKSSFGNATKRIRNLWPKLKKSVWKRNQKNKHAVTKTEKDQTAATEQSKNWQCIALAGSKQEEASRRKQASTWPNALLQFWSKCL